MRVLHGVVNNGDVDAIPLVAVPYVLHVQVDDVDVRQPGMVQVPLAVGQRVREPGLASGAFGPTPVMLVEGVDQDDVLLPGGAGAAGDLDVVGPRLQPVDVPEAHFPVRPVPGVVPQLGASGVLQLSLDEQVAAGGCGAARCANADGPRLRQGEAEKVGVRGRADTPCPGDVQRQRRRRRPGRSRR